MSYRGQLLAEAAKIINMGYGVLLIFVRPVDTPKGMAQEKTPAPGWGPIQCAYNLEEFERRLDRTLDGAFPIDIEDLGLAIATTGLVTVIDDDRGGNSIKEQYRENGLDITGMPRVKTPRGFHLYCKGVRRGKSTIAFRPGLDVKGHHGYCICPPSTINGKAYEWQVPLVPVDDLPPLPEFIKQGRQAERDRSQDQYSDHPSDHQAGYEDISQVIALKGELIREGERNNTVYQVACRLADLGIPIGQAREMIDEQLMPHIENGDDFDSETPIMSGYKNRQSAVGSKSVKGMFNVVATDEPTDDLMRMLGIMTMGQAAALPEPEWTIKGLLTKGTPNALMGRSGDHKTNTAISLAYHVARGLDFGPYLVPKAVPVLFVDLEGRYGTTARLKAMIMVNGGIEPKDGMAFHMGAKRAEITVNLMENYPLEIVARFAKAHGIGLIIIDTLTIALGGMENDPEKVVPAVKRLNKLCDETGATVLVLAHTPKQRNKGENPTIRGSSAFGDSMNTRMSVERKEDATPLTVTLKPFHVKDAESGREMELQDVAPHGQIALMPAGKLGPVGADTMARWCLTKIEYNDGKSIGKRETCRATDCPLPARHAGKAFDELHDLEFEGGIFEIFKAGSHKRLRWNPYDAPTVDEMLR